MSNIFNEYPYRNYSDLNLDYILKELTKMNSKLTEYVKQSTITFHDPITWNITDQYTTNTVVVDSDGTAYLSVRPVPAGVDITNTDYWQPIFNYDDSLNKLISGLTVNTRTTGVLPVDVDSGMIVWYNGAFYRTTSALPAGAVIIPGTNAEKITFAEWVKALIKEINVLIVALTDRVANEESTRSEADTALGERITAEATARAKEDSVLGERLTAVNDSLSERISQEITKRTEADTALSKEIKDLENRLTKGTYFNVLDYGAVGDGVADDTAAIQAAITAAENSGGGTVFMPHKTKYRVTQTITMTGKSYILGDGMTEIVSNATPVFKCYGWYGGLDNLLLTGNGSNSAILFDTLHENPQIPFIWRLQHLEISNFVNAIFDNSDGDSTHYVVDIMVFDVYIRRNYGNSIDIKRSRGFMTFRNVKVDNTYNESYTPYIGFKFNDVIGLELEMCDVVASGRTNLPREYLHNQCAFQIIGSGEGVSSIWLKRCVFDSGLGRGFYISGINMVQMFECESFSIFGNCFDLNSLKYLLMANSIASGGQGVPTAPDDVRGLLLNNVNKAVISNSHIWNIKGPGVMYYQSTNICNTNMYIENCNTGVWCDSGNILNSNIIINNCNTPRVPYANCHFVNTYIDGNYELNS